jgi:hypothetical protein
MGSRPRARHCSWLPPRHLKSGYALHPNYAGQQFGSKAFVQTSPDLIVSARLQRFIQQRLDTRNIFQFYLSRNQTIFPTDRYMYIGTSTNEMITNRINSEGKEREAGST